MVGAGSRFDPAPTLVQIRPLSRRKAHRLGATGFA